jgi:hypothetical protein
MEACKILPVVQGSPDKTCETPKKIPTIIIIPIDFLFSYMCKVEYGDHNDLKKNFNDYL